jgi:hypothetical protein
MHTFTYRSSSLLFYDQRLHSSIVKLYVPSPRTGVAVYFTTVSAYGALILPRPGNFRQGEKHQDFILQAIENGRNKENN